MLLHGSDTACVNVREPPSHRLVGLSTPGSPSVITGGVAGSRASLVLKTGRGLGDGPGELICTPVRARKPSDVLASPGCTRDLRVRGLKRPLEVLDTPTPEGPPASSPSSSSSSRRAPRVQAKMALTVSDGEAAFNFRSTGEGGRHWLSTFIFDKSGLQHS